MIEITAIYVKICNNVFLAYLKFILLQKKKKKDFQQEKQN